MRPGVGEIFWDVDEEVGEARSDGPPIGPLAYVCASAVGRRITLCVDANGCGAPVLWLPGGRRQTTSGLAGQRASWLTSRRTADIVNWPMRLTKVGLPTHEVLVRMQSEILNTIR